MRDQIEFVRARLDEDEQRWTRLRDAVWPDLVVVVPSPDTGSPGPDEPAGCVTVGPQYTPKAFARVWNPVQAGAMGLPTNFDCGWRYHESAIELLSPETTARALAEVAFKRDMLRWCERSLFWDDDGEPIAEDWGNTVIDGRWMLRAMAGVYADHDDYNPDWTAEEK